MISSGEPEREVTGSLAGKVILVTGSSRGIGLGVARRLAEAGATVVVSARNEEDAEAAAAKLPGAAFGVGADLSDPQGAHDLVTAAASRGGHLDGLVNNAGASLIQPSAETTQDDWRRIVELNLTASFFCAQAAEVAMVQGGAIVNIVSIAAFTGLPGRAAYAASKGGLVALTRVLSVEWAPRIRVNAIAPGYIRTDSLDKLIKAGKLKPDQIERRTPAARFGTPEDVASAALFLISDDASFVTGQILAVDGGWLVNGGAPRLGQGIAADPAAGIGNGQAN